jgi:hypothetical protein
MNIADPPYPIVASEGEADLLTKTLRDYTETLRKRVDALDGLALYISTFLAAALFIIPVLSIARLFEVTRSEVSSSVFITAAIIGGMAGILTITTFARRGLRTAKDARRTMDALETLVRRASQLRDRHNFTYTQRIYIDIALSDAESALQQASKSLRAPLALLFVPGFRYRF